MSVLYNQGRLAYDGQKAADTKIKSNKPIKGRTAERESDMLISRKLSCGLYSQIGGLYLNETERILLAQCDPQTRELLLHENDAYIRRCASKAAKRAVDSHDDAYSEALIAFNNAVTAYRPDKGSFYALAATAIQNRVTDLLRKESRCGNVIPFSSLTVQGEEGHEKPFEAIDSTPIISDTALEIEALRQEMQGFGISFFDLPKASPRLRRTRAACKEVIVWLLKRPDLICGIRERKCLPAKQITEALHTSSKILERNRNYIIAGVLICAGNYPIMQEYIDFRKEGR